jgi:hypothetical protein
MMEPLGQDDVTRALRMLGQAPPPEGMEARIAGRLQRSRAELVVARRGVGARWMFAAAAVAAVAGVVVMSMVHRPHGAPLPQVVVEPTQVQPLVVRTEAVGSAIRSRHTSHVVRVRVDVDPAYVPSLSAPPLPLTQEERLLMALAQTPHSLPAIAGVTHSETVANHGLGQNAIFELDHENLTQMKTTLPGGTE